jgi:hypothetical protein
MRDWDKTQERFLRFDLPHQLGYIASTLGTIKTQIHLDIPPGEISATIQEGQYFIEWVLLNPETETSTELLELKERLKSWNENLLLLNSSPADRAAIAEQAQEWSVRILNDSGLLLEQDFPFPDA